MGGVRLSKKELDEIVSLRQKGTTLYELKKITGRSNGTLFNCIKGVSILPEFQDAWRVKKGGSKVRSEAEWEKARKNSKELIAKICRKEKLLILACLYWGEGNKKELNLINSDPSLVYIFIECLKEIGVKKDDLKITLRMYEDMDREKIIQFWSGLLKVSPDSILNVNVLPGKKKGKLLYGMCRVRVSHGGPYFKIIMSMIDLIRSDFNAAVVQWIEQDTPNV